MKTALTTSTAFLLLAACSSTPTTLVNAATTTELIDCPKATAAQAPEVLWSRESFLAPESVAYDHASRMLYVSNIVGGADARDGKGWISRISVSGQDLTQKWSKTPLHAPKGLAFQNGLLWVADLDRVVAFDLKTGKASGIHAIAGAKFLNDVAAVPGSRDILVSDMRTDRIHRIRGAESSVFAEGAELESPNGIMASGPQFLIAGWGKGLKEDFSTASPGRVLTLDPVTKKTMPWTAQPLGHLDGIQKDGPDAVIVSDWVAGKVFHLKKSGACVTLLDGLPGAADLAFIPETRTLIVPVTGADRIVAYRLPRL